jgi:hypothetical protein
MPMVLSRVQYAWGAAVLPANSASSRSSRIGLGWLVRHRFPFGRPPRAQATTEVADCPLLHVLAAASSGTEFRVGQPLFSVTVDYCDSVLFKSVADAVQCLDHIESIID